MTPHKFDPHPIPFYLPLDYSISQVIVPPPPKHYQTPRYQPRQQPKMEISNSGCHQQLKFKTIYCVDLPDQSVVRDLEELQTASMCLK